MAQELPDFERNFQKDALSNQNVERVRDSVNIEHIFQLHNNLKLVYEKKTEK